MTRSFVFTNHKGGVGKSTSATNIALGMVNLLRRANATNCRVLIIDTDSQGHASLVTTGRKDYGADDSLYTVLMADRSNAPQTLMNCLAATDAIVPVEPRYLETVGLTSVIQKINDIRDGWRHPNLRVSGLLVTKMDTRVRGHNHLLAEIQAHPVLGKLVLGVIPVNEAVSYAHHNHQSLFHYDPRSSASKAYIHVVAALVRYMKAGA